MAIVEVQMPSRRMVAAVKAFLARHPEYREQVFREWQDHMEQEPFLTEEKVLVGYERGEMPTDFYNPLDSPKETVDYGSYDLTGHKVLRWQDL